MPIPIPLDHVIELARINDDYVERRALKTITGISLTGDEARSEWPRVLEHKWYMSERMGRDVGMRVAAIDYFDNIRPAPLREAVAGRSVVADPVHWLEGTLSSFTNALRGTLALAIFVHLK